MTIKELSLNIDAAMSLYLSTFSLISFLCARGLMVAEVGFELHDRGSYILPDHKWCP